MNKDKELVFETPYTFDSKARLKVHVYSFEKQIREKIDARIVDGARVYAMVEEQCNAQPGAGVLEKYRKALNSLADDTAKKLCLSMNEPAQRAVILAQPDVIRARFEYFAAEIISKHFSPGNAVISAGVLVFGDNGLSIDADALERWAVKRHDYHLNTPKQIDAYNQLLKVKKEIDAFRKYCPELKYWGHYFQNENPSDHVWMALAALK